MANSNQLQNLYKLFQLLFGANVIAIISRPLNLRILKTILYILRILVGYPMVCRYN